MPWQTGKGLGNVPAPSGPSARYTLVVVLMVIGRGNRTVSRGGFSALPRTALDRRILFATWTWCLIVGHGIKFVEDDGLVFFSFGGGRGGGGGCPAGCFFLFSFSLHRVESGNLERMVF